MDNGTVLLGGIVVCFLISMAVLIIDQRAKAQITAEGKYELKLGYSAYLGLGLQFLGLLIMILSALDAFYQQEDLVMLFLFFIAIILFAMVYLILEIRNHKVYYEEEEISKTNVFKAKKVIAFKDLSAVKYDLFGWGRNLVLEDIDGNKLKVHWYLNGFSSLLEFLKKKNLL